MTKEHNSGERAIRRGRVLVVDPDLADGLRLARVLVEMHAVVVVQTAATALDRLTAGERFDAIIADGRDAVLFDAVGQLDPGQHARMIAVVDPGTRVAPDVATIARPIDAAALAQSIRLGLMYADASGEGATGAG